MIEFSLVVLTFIFLIGLSIGSFLNVLIYRLPLSLSIGGRSFCPKCKKQIAWYDNVPLLSYLLLGGKCRRCHSPISAQYPLVEFITGGLFAIIAYFQFGQNFQLREWIHLIYLWILISGLTVIFFVDLKHQIIPDVVLFPLIIATFFYQLIILQFEIVNYLLSGLGASLFFLLLYLGTKGRGMGFGDVKFVFLMGLVLGFPKIIVALYLAFLTGAAVGIILIVFGRRRFGQHIPFGPFLIVGTLAALFWGSEILKWTTFMF